jgi:hypothetical protein
VKNSKKIDNLGNSSGQKERGKFMLPFPSSNARGVENNFSSCRCGFLSTFHLMRKKFSKGESCLAFFMAFLPPLCQCFEKVFADIACFFTSHLCDTAVAKYKTISHQIITGEKVI